ncbi:solute carrier family 22 member 7-like isoform X2 [Hydractinia symbiolongicarpus]|uniref:solute carrier family 22 member 7-like isoform X2 n=1 Tax=Hydractinia symbiolongicarpus TaxID=13093 RepID=UPI00254D9A8D|nr:solute carrier family 22 member 7-like isoform X2 [Hydractinia symbiolongicarpus]
MAQDPLSEKKVAMHDNKENSQIADDCETTTRKSFDLVCDKDAFSHIASSGLFIGQMIGAIMFGWLADRYGRKKIMFSCLFCLCVVSFISSFSPNIWWFTAMRVLSGFFHGGIVVPLMVLSVELVGPRYRGFVGLVTWNSWTIALCFMSLQSWYVPEWRKLTMLLSIPYLFVPIIGAIWTPESVRWYRSQHMLLEAEKILRKVAQVNKKVYPAVARLEPIIKKNSSDASYKDLFCTIRRSWRTLSFCLMWFTNDAVYYGVSMAASDFGGNLHRDFVLMSLIEIPVNLSTIYIINKIGRKKGAITGYIVTSTSLILFGCFLAFNIAANIYIRIAIGLIGKAFGLVSWCACEIWSAELYPTNIRSHALGLLYVLSQMGASSSPWISQWMKKFHVAIPSFTIGGLALLSCVLATTLPETKNIEISDTAEINKDSVVDEDEVTMTTVI